MFYMKQFSKRTGFWPRVNKLQNVLSKSRQLKIKPQCLSVMFSKTNCTLLRVFGNLETYILTLEKKHLVAH